MKRALALSTIGTLLLAVWFATTSSDLEAAPATRNISHDVFFTMKDDSPEAKQALIDGCKKFLVKHPGVLFFSVGTLTDALNRPVNDREFDVALHIVFKDQAAHDAYQVSKLHTDFVAAHSNSFDKVRVFDSDVDIVPVK